MYTKELLISNVENGKVPEESAHWKGTPTSKRASTFHLFAGFHGRTIFLSSW